MVKKYFRQFICAVCAAMSVVCGMFPTFNAYVSAASVDMLKEDSTETEETPLSEDTAGEENLPEEESQSAETQPEENSDESIAEAKQVTEESESNSEDMTEIETEEEKSPDSESESEIQNNVAKSILITMKQLKETITPGDEIKQTVSIAYKDAVDSVITYIVDPSLDIKSLEIGSNTYLEGGKAVITSAAGETEVKITATLDLSNYENVSKIVFYPKIRSYSGMEAKFTANMKLKTDAITSGINEVSCKTEVAASNDNASAAFSSSLSTKINSGSIKKPFLSLTYEGKEYGDKESISGAIEFEKEFVLNLSSIGMESYGKSDKYVYTITIPAFVTLKEIQVPTITGASKVKLFATIDEKETDLGETNPGDVVKVESANVTEVRFEITPEENGIDTTLPGKLVFLNDVKENKGINNASFTANAKTSINDVEYSSNSNIISVNVKSRTIKDPEVKPPQTNPSESNSGGNSGGDNSGGNNGGNPSQTEPQTEPETENPNDTARKQEESERKEKVKKEALQNEQELKNKQASILAERLSKLRAESGSTGSGSTATVTTKKTASAASTAEKKYASWKVKPIDESIIDNFIPKEIAPIMENIVENLIPTTGNDTSETEGIAADNETPQTETEK